MCWDRWGGSGGFCVMILSVLQWRRFVLESIWVWVFFIFFIQHNLHEMLYKLWSCEALKALISTPVAWLRLARGLFVPVGDNRHVALLKRSSARLHLGSRKWQNKVELEGGIPGDGKYICVTDKTCRPSNRRAGPLFSFTSSSSCESCMLQKSYLFMRLQSDSNTRRFAHRQRAGED